MSGYETAAFAIGANGFVKAVLDTWDSVEKKRNEQKESKVLTKELEQFGGQERREILEADLKISHTFIRDQIYQVYPKEKVIKLAGCFKQLNDALEAIQGLVEAIGMKTSRRLHILGRPPIAKELKTKVTFFNEKSSELNQTLSSLSVVTLNRDVLLSTSRDTLISSTAERKKVNDTIYMTKASFPKHDSPEFYMKDVLVEKMFYTANSRMETLRATWILISKLHSTKPSWNIPYLYGYQDNPDESRPCIELLFERPHPEMKLKTLDRLYRTSAPEPSLNLRVELCQQIAVAVLKALAIGLTHQDVRPQNLLVTFEKGDDDDLEQASLFLCGWANAQLIDGTETRGLDESTLSRIIYQYPKRRALENMAKEDDNVGYSIYSMGVCMLELLIWDPLIRPGDTEMAAPVLSDAYMREFEYLGYNEASDMPPDYDSSGDEQVQNTLISMTESLIPRKAGYKMMELVRRCLTCLNIPPNSESGVFDTAQEKGTLLENFSNQVFDDFSTLRAAI
ncbi:hypothetical protein F4821DRAFT_274554 [Hypoxylon rubiginosum]|uniref:Uncharacterized protein n=1 Tax=Hypoxylon rubiginosum TaxID=110542 RepID=A0ACC0CNM7_9PEZI|nr:hypothetical protein F4821DRAFT_274554 [Hypoxylon rubiginosum]